MSDPYRDDLQARLDVAEYRLRQAEIEINGLEKKLKRPGIGARINKMMLEASVFRIFAAYVIISIFICSPITFISIYFSEQEKPVASLQLDDSTIGFSCKEACVAKYNDIVATEVYKVSTRMNYITCGCLSSKWNGYNKTNISLINFHYLWKIKE